MDALKLNGSTGSMGGPGPITDLLRLAQAEHICDLDFHRQQSAGKRGRVNRPQDIGTCITPALCAASSSPHFEASQAG